MLKTVLLGGTRGMGRSVGRKLSERGDALYLLGRNPEQLDKSAADFAARGPAGTQVSHTHLDLSDPSTFVPALDAAEAALGGLECVIVTAAMFATQDELEADTELAARLLDVNFTKTIVFCEEVRKRMLARGGGTLVVFSSVAGERGRKTVGIYGATKAGLSHYLESLDHKYRDQGLVTICVKPGFVKTGATAGLKPPPFAGEPDEVATSVVKAIDRGTPLIYAPAIWQLVMLAIRNLPRLVMRRVGF
jgi:NAD(P)-dependent dehydrogenase (short-subunit alcohol dehydrogenase family)